MPRAASRAPSRQTAGERSAPRRKAAARDTLNIRIKAEDRGPIDRAAHSLGKTRTDLPKAAPNAQ